MGEMTILNPMEVIERVVTAGDLAKMTPGDRVAYYSRVCESVGLNPLTRPFDYISLNGKLVLYAKRDAADQLRALHKVAIRIVDQKAQDGIYVVTVEARTQDGRSDSDVGAVPFPANLQGEARANAVMKAITKAKRRVTLSICGLGLLDETEVAGVPGAQRWQEPQTALVASEHDAETGEVAETKPKVSSSEARRLYREAKAAIEAGDYAAAVRARMEAEPHMDGDVKVQKHFDDLLMTADPSQADEEGQTVA